MEFRLLGQIGLYDDHGRPVEVRTGRTRSLLALLLVRAPNPVEVDSIIELLWTSPPGSAKAYVHNMISTLRRAMPVENLFVSGPGSYRADLGAHTLDVAEFRRATVGGRAALTRGEFEPGERLLSEALAWWRGPAVADAVEPLARSLRFELEAERLATTELRLDAWLALGSYDLVLGGAAELLADHTYQEKLYGRLMLALCGLGRRAEALEVYERAYRTLTADLGIEPGQDLRALHQQVLSGTTPQAGPRPATTTAPPALAELPPAARRRRANCPTTRGSTFGHGDDSTIGRECPETRGIGVECRVLGPVQVRVDERVVAVGPPQQQLLLAALAVDAGHPVTIDALLDRLWDHPPDGARRALQVLVARLRRTVSEAVSTEGERVRIVRCGGGYALEIDPQQVDLQRFRLLVAEARGALCTAERRVWLLRQAVQLWHGEPLSGLAGTWALRTRQSLRQQHLDAVAAWARVELQAGDPAAILGPLTDLSGEHPLSESLAELLMRALAATGRPAEALTVYASLRRRMAEDLGTDPTPELQAMHQQLLRGQLDSPPRPSAPDAPVVPQQLPAAVSYFAGRVDELATLTSLLQRRASTGGTVVISAIGGTAGVGKTALAVYWAHQVAAEFPDGQLYVNLRGFDQTGQVMDPAEAVRRFLDALGVPPERIPVHLDAQAALYRSQLAGKRVLVVLDNARDTTQVRPLLPGAPGCLVLVTSRNQLTSLVAADGAHPLTLDLLTPGEAGQLLAQRLGAGRVAAEPAAVAEIITRCARLPLAAALVTARAATRPRFGLHLLAEELRDTQQRWQVLSGDDPSTDVQAVFSWSYEALTPPAARLFRLLGLHPGPDLSAPAATSLAGAPIDTVKLLLGQLSRANLLAEPTPGRYSLHDLLRAYAAHLAHTTDSDQQRHCAHRILDHYLHTAHAAYRLLSPAADPITLSAPQPGVTTEQLTGYQQALDWFTTEHRVLLAAVDHAATAGFDIHAWQLTRTLAPFLDRRGHWHDWAAAGRAAVAAAQRLADPPAQICTHGNLARAYTRLGQFEDAQIQLSHALDLANQTGDLTAQAHALHSLAHLWEQRGDYPRALDHVQQSLHLSQAAGHRRGQAHGFMKLGWVYAQLGQYQQGIAACRRAITLFQDIDDGAGQAGTWSSLGYAYHHLGNYARAITCYQHALTLFRGFGDHYNEAATLSHLGDTHHTTGNGQAAHTAWQQALAILRALQHPDADQIRNKLAAIEVPTANRYDTESHHAGQPAANRDIDPDDCASLTRPVRA